MANLTAKGISLEVKHSLLPTAKLEQAIINYAKEKVNQRDLLIERHVVIRYKQLTGISELLKEAEMPKFD